MVDEDACLNVLPRAFTANPASDTAVVEEEASVADPDNDASESTLSN